MYPSPSSSSLYTVLGSLAFAATVAAQMPPSVVRVAEVTREQVQEYRRVTGNLRASERARVAALEPGRVVAVEVEEADEVEAGQVLARIDDRRLELDLEEARAELAEAESLTEIRRAEAEAAQGDLESYRAAERGVRGSVSALTLRAAVRDAAVAKARVNVAERTVARLQAAVALLEVRLADTEIRAPFAGRVILREVEPGEWCNAGDPVVTLIGTHHFEAWIEVPEQAPYDVLAGVDEIDVRIDTLGRDLRAGDARVVPDVDPRSRRYLLIANLESTPETPLAAGMSLTAQVPSGRMIERLVVPDDAILRDGGGYFVYRVIEQPERGMVVAPVSVDIAFRSGEIAHVESAELDAGARVVVEGNERLRPMAPIEIAGSDGQQKR